MLRLRIVTSLSKSRLGYPGFVIAPRQKPPMSLKCPGQSMARFESHHSRLSQENGERPFDMKWCYLGSDGSNAAADHW
jgi:hypothetical protein